MWTGRAWGDGEWASGPVDNQAPTLFNRAPSSGAVDQPLYTNVSFDLIDTDSGVDTSSISVTLDGVPALTAGVFQPGYAGTITPITYGYTVTVNPDVDFPLGDTIVVVVNATDLNWQPNAMAPVTWSFTVVNDTTGPSLVNPSPVGLGPMDAGYARDSHIMFDIVDAGFSSVDILSVVITVNGVTAFTAGAAANGFVVAAIVIADGYAFNITAPTLWVLGETVTVSVDAQDTYAPPNPMPTTGWSFLARIDDGPPQVVNNAPIGLQRPLTEQIRLDVIDTTLLPLIPASVVIRVNGVVAWEAQAQANGFFVLATNVADGIRYVITAPFDWTPGALVTVTVDASDGINTMPTALWTFVGTTGGFSRCNPEPLLASEERLREPFPQPSIETIRRTVLNFISTDDMLDHRIRGVFLTAHLSDFRAVFLDVLPAPAAVYTETVCKRRKLFELYADLQVLRSEAGPALEELRALGLSDGYINLTAARVDGTSPQQYIGAMCAILLFASLLQPAT